MASPIPERPLRRPRQAEKPKRNLTSKEQRRKKTEHIVTWGLAFVFAITSVGFMIGFSSDSRGGGKDGPQSQIQVLQERLKAEVDEAAAKPDQPQYRFSQATTYEEMANAALVEGKADDAKAYMAKSVEALRDTLKVSPGHLPALKRLSSRLIGEAKYQDAVDILTAGIKAEKEDLARRRAGAAASPAPSGEPMVQPDTELRSLLFAAYSALSGKDAQAEEVAREGFTLNPREFVRGVGTTVMLLESRNQPESAVHAIDVALRAAQAVNDKEAAMDLEKMKLQVALARAQASPAPGAAATPPTTPPAASTAPQPSGQPAAASPVSPASPVASPAETTASPASGASPEGAPAAAPSPSPNP